MNALNFMIWFAIYVPTWIQQIKWVGSAVAQSGPQCCFIGVAEISTILTGLDGW